MVDTEDERQVQALSTQAPDEPLRVAVRPRRANRRLDRPGADRGEHGVERGGELGVPIADQELELRGPFPDVSEQVAGLLGGPLPRRVRRHTQDVDPTGADLHHEEHIQPAQQHGVHVQEVTRQQTTCLGGEELPPGRVRPPRRRAKLRGGKDPADRALPHAIAECKHFALDPAVPPGGILRGEADHQLADLDSDRRSARPVREGPLPGDQPPVPAQQRAGRHQPKSAQPAREPGQRGKNRSVGPVQPGPTSLPTQHRHLMAQDEYLRVLGRVATAEQRKPAEHTSHHQIEQPDRQKPANT